MNSSIEKVRDYLAAWGQADHVLEFGVSSATVELAAQAVGVAPARIAKSLTKLAASVNGRHQAEKSSPARLLPAPSSIPPKENGSFSF